MKKEKTLSITLYVFSVLALCYGTYLLFQAYSQIAAYNQSSYVPMAFSEKIVFLFSNTYVPLFFAVILYGLANVVEMLNEFKYPELTDSNPEIAVQTEEVKEAAPEDTSDFGSSPEESEDQGLMEEDEEKQEDLETSQTEDEKTAEEEAESTNQETDLDENIEQ